MAVGAWVGVWVCVCLLVAAHCKDFRKLSLASDFIDKFFCEQLLTDKAFGSENVSNSAAMSRETGSARWSPGRKRPGTGSRPKRRHPNCPFAERSHCWSCWIQPRHQHGHSTHQHVHAKASPIFRGGPNVFRIPGHVGPDADLVWASNAGHISTTAKPRT